MPDEALVRAKLKSRDAKERLSGARDLRTWDYGPEMIEVMVAAFQNESDPGVRQVLMQEITAQFFSTPTPSLVKTLVAALKDRDDSIRWTAAVTLGMEGYAEALDTLVQYIQGSHRGRAEFCINLLEKYTDPRVIDILEIALTKSAAPDAVVLLLGRLQAPKAHELVMKALNSPSTRIPAEVALAARNDPQAVKLLLGELAHELNDYHFGMVIEALGQFNDQAVFDNLAAIVTKTPIHRQVAGGRLSLAQYAHVHRITGVITALERVGNPNTLKPLLAIYPDIFACHPAIIAMGHFLERAPESAASEDLRAICDIRIVYYVDYHERESGDDDKAIRVDLEEPHPQNNGIWRDCALLKSLARKELERRGLPAD